MTLLCSTQVATSLSGSSLIILVSVCFGGSFDAWLTKDEGIWLVHCHIAWHASSGLALQILERQQDIKPTVGSLAPVEQVCDGWDEMNLKFSQDDSGI